ncbi:MAG: sulfatase [Pseudomonadota bacterium]
MPRSLRAIACCLALGACTPPPAPAPPSILWITLDTMRADHLALYGGRVQTPQLEALAARGLVFEQAISHFPETQLSHWSMLTGTLPGVHGDVPAQADSSYTGLTAAQILGQAGYATAAFIGGVTLRAADTGLDRGFHLYDDAVPMDPRDMRRPAAELARQAGDWIAAQGGHPWFAFVHAFDAHFPYTPRDPARYDPGYAGAFDGTDATLAPHRDFGAPMAPADLAHVVALYDAEISEQDEALGALLEGLPAGTLVVVTADHGESFEHGYLFNHRQVLYDSVLHVPLVIAARGLAPGRVATQVGLSDVLPTVLALAGVSSREPFQGQPLVAADGAGGFTPRPAEALESARMVFATTDPYHAGALFAARTPAWKAVWSVDGAPQAYDLAADPGEVSPQPVPEALREAPEAHSTLVAAMAGVHRALPQRPPPMDVAPMLGALGYLATDRTDPPAWLPW